MAAVDSSAAATADRKKATKKVKASLKEVTRTAEVQRVAEEAERIRLEEEIKQRIAEEEAERQRLEGESFAPYVSMGSKSKCAHKVSKKNKGKSVTLD